MTSKVKVPQGLRATGWKLLIKPYKGPERVGGIILPDETKHRNMVGTVVCQLIDIGPLCWSDDVYKGQPWAAVGDWVLIGKLAGTRFLYGDEEYRFINEDEIQGITVSPDLVARI